MWVPREGVDRGALISCFAHRRESSSFHRALSHLRFRHALASTCFGELSRDPAIERSVLATSLLIQTEGGALERVKDVAEVELSDVGDGLVAHGVRGWVAMGPVGVSDRGPSTSATSTTIAVMLSSPPRPFASEISACTLRSGVAREISSVWRRRTSTMPVSPPLATRKTSPTFTSPRYVSGSTSWLAPTHRVMTLLYG